MMLVSRALRPAAPLQRHARASRQQISVRCRASTLTEQTVVEQHARLVEVQMAFPLGLVLERSAAGNAVVAEVTPGGAADASGVHVGDVVRASSAMTMAMTYPTANVLFGGVGRPKLVKQLVPTAKLPFPKIMDAVRSNSTAAGGDDAIVLVLERIGDGVGKEGQQQQQQQQQREAVAAGVSGSEQQAAGAAFDPQIFQ